MERYERSVAYSYDALRLADRAFFFDNSGTNFGDYSFFAEKADGFLQIPQGTLIPWWFRKYCLREAPESRAAQFF
jgi:predicted ABC-type ATPase